LKTLLVFVYLINSTFKFHVFSIEGEWMG